MKKVLIVLGALVVILIAFLAYQGAFVTVQVVDSTSPGYLVVGVDHTGPYEDIGPAFQRVSGACKEVGMEKPRMMGIYFDHPDSVAKEKLRSFAGVILTTPADTAKFLSKQGFHTYTIPPGNCIATELKTTGMASMIIAAMKAYPALSDEFMKNHTNRGLLQVYEVYEEGYTHFVMQFND